MIVGRKPREEVGVQTPGEPWEHSPMSSGRLQRRHVSEAKPRDEWGGGGGSKCPFALQFLTWAVEPGSSN